MGGLFSNDDNKIYPDNEIYGESSQIASTNPRRTTEFKNISRRKPAINKSRPKRRSSPKKKRKSPYKNKRKKKLIFTL